MSSERQCLQVLAVTNNPILAIHINVSQKGNRLEPVIVSLLPFQPSYAQDTQRSLRAANHLSVFSLTRIKEPYINGWRYHCVTLATWAASADCALPKILAQDV